MAPALAASTAVPSIESLSTTSISDVKPRPSSFWSGTLLIVAPTAPSSLRAGITNDTMPQTVASVANPPMPISPAWFMIPLPNDLQRLKLDDFRKDSYRRLFSSAFLQATPPQQPRPLAAQQSRRDQFRPVPWFSAAGSLR